MINTSKGRIALILIVFLTMMTAISQPVSASTSYIVSRSDKKYSYTDMKKDIEALTAKYPDRLTSQVLGESADGRNIYAPLPGKSRGGEADLLSQRECMLANTSTARS